MANEEAYQLYLRRYESLGKTMFKRLTAEEFATKWQDFQDIRNSYEAMLGRGLTVDNVLQKELRERAAELVVELPESIK
jgi:hypothetical protein